MPHVARRLPGRLRAPEPGWTTEADVVALLRRAGHPVAAVPAPDAWVVEGVNDRVQLARTAARLNAMIVRGWQLAGVTVVDPATTWIDLRATLAEDVELLPGTHIAGSTTVARGARIGPQTTLLDCEVGEDAVITRTDATPAVIGAHSRRPVLRGSAHQLRMLVTADLDNPYLQDSRDHSCCIMQ